MTFPTFVGLFADENANMMSDRNFANFILKSKDDIGQILHTKFYASNIRNK